MLRFTAFAQLVFASALVACGSSDAGSSSSSDTGTPVGDGATTDAPLDTSTHADTSTDAIPTDTLATDTIATDTATTPDGDASASNVGSACTDGSTCSTDFCITDSRFGGGYCSAPITECPAPGGGPDPCPTGSDCVGGLGFAVGGASDFCLRECGVDADCRVADGYACCPGLGHSGHAVCAPKSYCP